MAVTDSTQKPHVYDLLNRLNAAFARVNRNMEALGQVGIFEPETMKPLHRLSEQLRAESNSRLLTVLREIEERDLAALRNT
jgi:hypothetical protein